MGTLEEKIVGVLKASSEPMRAIDIARAIGHEKRDVNRVIYKMPGIEQVEKSPPKWRIRPEAAHKSTSPARTCTTSGGTFTDFQATSQGESLVQMSTSDLELDQKLLTVLKQSPREAKSALQLARDLGKVGRRDVNPSLHRLEKQGLVRKLSESTDAKPLWQLSMAVHPVGPTLQCEQPPSFHTLSGSDDTSTCAALDADAIAKWKGDDLYTRTDSNSGSVVFTPLSKGEILAKVLKPPVGQEAQSTAALDDDHEQHVEGAEDEPKRSLEAESSPLLPTGKSTPLKKNLHRKLAANFTNPPSLSSPGESDPGDSQKKMIIDVLAQHMGDEPLTTLEIAEALEMPMRATAMKFLRELKGDGIVEELAGKISRWTLSKD